MMEKLVQKMGHLRKNLVLFVGVMVFFCVAGVSAAAVARR